MNHTINSTNNDTAPLSLYERCQYTNKQCPNRRLTKRNGNLHRLCLEHRDKANENHRRWVKNCIERAKAKAAASMAGDAGVATSQTTASWQTQQEDHPSDDAIDSLLLDEDELDEYLSEVTLMAGELLAIRVDVANAFRT